MTIVNPLCATYVAGAAAVRWERFHTKRATQKRNKYGLLTCTEAGLDFTPLVVVDMLEEEREERHRLHPSSHASRLGSRRRAEGPLADIPPAPTAAPISRPAVTGSRGHGGAALARDLTRIAVSLACHRALGRFFWGFDLIICC